MQAQGESLWDRSPLALIMGGAAADNVSELIPRQPPWEWDQTTHKLFVDSRICQKRQIFMQTDLLSHGTDAHDCISAVGGRPPKLLYPRSY